MDVLYQPLLQNNNWIIFIFIFIMTLLVVLKKLFKHQFYNQLKLLNNTIWITSLKNNYSIVYNFYNIVYIIILSVLLSLMTLFYAKNFAFLELNSNFYFFLKFSFYFGLFFIIKHLLYFFFSLIFNIKSILLKVIYIKTSYLNFLTIFILTWLPIVLFNNFENKLIFKYACLISLLLALYFYVLIVKNNLKAVSKHFLYFILYLCTLEIAPVIILYKVFFFKFK